MLEELTYEYIAELEYEDDLERTEEIYRERDICAE